MKKIKKTFHSLRKGCLSCGGPLTATKEKFTRTCNNCAVDALHGFEKMGKGNIKGGIKDVLATSMLSGRQNAEGDEEVDEEELDEKTRITQKRLEAGLKHGRKKIERKLRAKGLSDEEIKNGLEKFEASAD